MYCCIAVMHVSLHRAIGTYIHTQICNIYSGCTGEYAVFDSRPEEEYAIVPLGSLFECFVTSLFELSISWQISVFPHFLVHPSPPIHHPRQSNRHDCSLAKEHKSALISTN